MSFAPNDIICVCRNIRKWEITESILLFNAKTVKEISNLTEAGTVCEGCHGDLEDILKEVKEI